MTMDKILAPTVNLAPEITDRLRTYAYDARGVFAENTLKALERDIRKFSTWCAERHLSSLPAATETVRDYVDYCGVHYKPATVSRYLASIAKLHQAVQLPDPTKAESVRLAMKRLRKEKGVRQKQARGLSLLDAEKIRMRLEGNPRDIRDWAMLLTARSAMLRPGEVSALNREDIALNDDGSGSLTVHRSKTDQEGQGAVQWLEPEAVAALKIWWDFSGWRPGAAFLTLKRWGRVNDIRVSRKDVSRAFQRLGELANIQEVSGHSARVGMAQDLTAHGIELPAIMQAGRWKSSRMPARYGEKLAAGRNAVAQLFQQVVKR